jgi:hypothetical protein
MAESRSFQQLDPVGGYSTRPVTVLLAAGILVYAAASTMMGWRHVDNAYLAIGALVALLAAQGAVLYLSSPLRAPFPPVGGTVVFALVALALILSVASSWWHGATLRDEWAPIVAGLVIVQLSPYRPSSELGAATLLLSIAAAFVAILRGPGSAAGDPALVIVVESTVPLLALGIASATYAAALQSGLERARVHAERDGDAAADGLRDDIVRSVQHDRIGVLNRSVVPFFTELLGRNEIVPDDSGRATAIAESIRVLMVADVDRSWIDMVIDQAGRASGERGWPGSEAVQDDERLASDMTTEERTVVRALIVALFEHPGFDPDGFSIVISRGDTGESRFELSAKLDNDDSLPRSGLAAYFAVLRIVFTDLQLTFHPPTLRLRFSYDHK